MDNSNVSNVLKIYKSLGILVGQSIEKNELIFNLNFEHSKFMRYHIENYHMIQIPVASC